MMCPGGMLEPRPWAWAPAMLLAAVLVTTPAVAQDQPLPHQAEAPTNEDLSRYRDMRQSGQMANRAVLEKVIRHELAKLTRADNYADFGEIRKALKYDHLLPAGRAASNLTHTAMVELILEVCQQILAGQYPAFSKVMAALLIGDLNQTEVGLSGTDPPPTPFQPALEVLLNLANDEAQLPGVRVAALYGIDRHAGLGIRNSQDQLQTQQVLLRIARGGEQTRGSYMRHRAIRALGRMGTAGENGAIAKTLLEIVDNRDLSLMMRAEAFRAFGFIDQTENAADTPVSLALRGANLVLAAADQRGRDFWDLQKVRVLQQVLGYVEWGLLGTQQDERALRQLFNHQVEGNVRENHPNGGIVAAADTQAQDVIVGINRRFESLRNLIFDVEDVDPRQVTAQIDQIQRHIRELENEQRPQAEE